MSPVPAGHVRRFLDFADSFRRGTEADVSNVDLKIRHSMRVLDEAEGLVRDLGLSPEDARAPLLAALYHDTGRFPQYDRYKTFRDADSEDHGLLGARTLVRLGMLADEPAPVRKTVIGAVRLHNAKVLPDNLVSGLDKAVRLVRDADKLDIMRVMIRALGSGSVSNPVLYLGLPDEPDRYTPSIAESVLAGAMADVRGMAYLNDFRLLITSWLYDVNLEPTRMRLRERNWLGIIMEGLPADDHIAAVRAKIEADLGRVSA